MEEKKISLLNDEFDINTAVKVVKSTLVILVLLVVTGFTIGFVYNRYIPRVYQSSSVIKIGVDETANQLYRLDNIYDKPIAGELGIIKSISLFEKSIGILPLDINYYSVGRFLDFENYKSSPYTVSYQMKNGNFYNKPIYIQFISPKKALISIADDFSNGLGKEVELNK